MQTNTAVSAYRNPTESERDRLILDHLPQIKYIAQRIALRVPSSVEMDDLISAGVLGLLDAVGKFDESRGVQFKTYAELRIRGAILDSLRLIDWAPRSLRKLSKEVEQAYARLEQRNGRPALDEEVAKELNMEIGEYYSVLDRLQGLNLGCFEVTETEQDTDGDSVSLVPTSDGDSPLDVCRKGELKEILARFIDLLPDRERLIVTLYHYEELTMKEVGRIVGVNESRISQLHTRALLRLRGKLHSVLRNRSGMAHIGRPGISCCEGHRGLRDCIPDNRLAKTTKLPSKQQSDWLRS